MLYRPKPKNSLNIDISPLIDVVFLLLIFFMVSTTFKDDSGLDLSLPASESRGDFESEMLTITVSGEEEIRLNDQDVDLTALRERIERALEGRDEKMVVLKVDETVSHGKVVEVMDAAKLAGAVGLTFATVAKPPEP